MKTLTLAGTPKNIAHANGIIATSKLFSGLIRVKKFTNQRGDNSGTPLTRDFLYTHGFDRQEYGGESRWTNNLGITIFEDDPEYRSENDCPFSFATYTKGDGSFKRGFTIESEEQLELLVFALSGQALEIIRYY